MEILSEEEGSQIIQTELEQGSFTFVHLSPASLSGRSSRASSDDGELPQSENETETKRNPTFQKTDTLLRPDQQRSPSPGRWTLPAGVRQGPNSKVEFHPRVIGATKKVQDQGHGMASHGDEDDKGNPSYAVCPWRFDAYKTVLISSYHHQISPSTPQIITSAVHLEVKRGAPIRRAFPF